MKNLLLVLVLTLSLGFTSCEKEDVLELPVSECSQIDTYYTTAILQALNATPGYIASPYSPGYDFQEQSEIYVAVAAQFIADWQDDLDAAGCPSIYNL